MSPSDTYDGVEALESPAGDVRDPPAATTANALERLPRPLAVCCATATRRPVLTVFLIALMVRAVAAVVVTIGWGGSLFLDDRSYSRLAAIAADGRLAHSDPYLQFLYDRTAALLVPITGLYHVFGPVELSGQLYVACLGAATAALTTRLALEIVELKWAVLAGLIVALLPSQIVWSSLILKDAAVWAALSGLTVVVAVAGRTTGRRLLPLGLIAVVLLVVLGFLRYQTLEIACVALVLASLLTIRPQRGWRVAGALAMLVAVPLAFGMGIGGATYVAHSRDPAQQRSLNAVGAGSAVVAGPSGTQSGAGTPAPPTLDEPPDATTGASNLSYLPTGLTVVALRPWPWESAAGSIGLRLARLESLLWYPILLLGAIGLTAAWSRRRVLAFPLLAGGASLAMYGLTEGNLGTAYRHRGEFVWVVCLLAALGARQLVGLRRRTALG